MSDTDRGQTLYDFLLGTTLFLLTVVLVLSLFDPLFAPFTSPSGAEDDAMADRFADRVVAEHATPFGDRTLDVDGESFDEETLETYRARAGLPAFRSVNVTLESGTGEVIERDGRVSGGPTRPDEPVATASRIVTLPPGEGCQDGCVLRVEVW